MELPAPAQRAKAIGVQDRPLGPARSEFITGVDSYTAALAGYPYRARALVDFGGNLVMAHADSAVVETRCADARLCLTRRILSPRLCQASPSQASAPTAS